MRVSQWSPQSCERKSAPDFGWVWLRCGGAGGGLSIASIHLTQLAGPGLSLLSLRFTRPAVLFASAFFISLHVAFRAPASSIKGRMLSVRLPLARGRGGVRLGSAGAHLSVDRFSPHQKATESDGTGGRFSGPARSVARKHMQNARLQCPLPLRTTRASSSRPGFHSGRFPALLSQGGTGAFVKASTPKIP